MKKRDIWALMILTALAIALGLGIYWGRSMETGAWGLSFRQEGAAPLGNASRSELQKYDGAYLGDPRDKVLYLTFDCGYENGNTGKILDTLAKHNAKGAFFLVGNYLQSDPDLVRRMVKEGHLVGNHTMHHPDMSKIENEESFRRELQGVEDLYRQVTGNELPRYYRPPRVVFSPENLKCPRSWGTARCSGVWPTWTGSRTTSPPGSRPWRS